LCSRRYRATTFFSYARSNHNQPVKQKSKSEKTLNTIQVEKFFKKITLDRAQQKARAHTHTPAFEKRRERVREEKRREEREREEVVFFLPRRAAQIRRRRRRRRRRRENVLSVKSSFLCHLGV